MKTYKFTAIAEKDLESIVDYTNETWGRHKATQYIDGLEFLAQKLADNPKMGTYQDEVMSDVVAFPYESHVLYYVESSQGITIIRVLHKRMNPHLHL